MRRLLVLPVVLGLFIVLPAGAQDAQQGPNRRTEAAPFQAVFSVRGIEFTEQQQASVAELREKYTPQLTELQRKRNAIYTAEQRRARRTAVQAARDAGKSMQEAFQAANAATQLTDEQQQQLAAVQMEQSELSATIQAEVRKLLTKEQQAQLRRQANGNGARRIAPTQADVKYGPYDRNVMDVWLAEADQPTPVLVSIHGGGFRGGNKSVDPGLLRECLDSGISVVAITYRLSDEAIAPAQFLDAARAIQFIRSEAGEWNLDPTRIAATGGSAGAGLSLWLGFHDDLADPDNDDPVLRQSSRLTCMAVYNGQTSYDPRFIRELFPGTDTYKHSALAQLYDVDLGQLDNLPEEKYRLFEEVSPLTHLSRDDPPALLIYASQMDTRITNPGVGIHHPRFGEVLKEKMDDLGIECRVETGVGRGDGRFAQLVMPFLREHLQ
jgi:acetyl esterase/lipase